MLTFIKLRFAVATIRRVVACGWIILALTAVDAYAAKTPQSLSSDARIREVTYDRNQVYEITGMYGYQTSIEFDTDEVIRVVALGDTIAWQTKSYQNQLFLKPVESKAQTDLKVVTNKRTYLFTLRAVEQGTMPPTYMVRFRYRDDALVLGADAKTPSPTVPEVANFNFRYALAGDQNAVNLDRVFDNGKSTFFLPLHEASPGTIYKVEADGTESVLNVRREGKYLVIDRIERQYVLRVGNAHLCVRNEAYAAPKVGS